jgi:DNA polymerase-1
MMQQVAKLLKSPIPKVNQNIKYDKRILERWGFEVNNVVGDTMLASSTLYCEFPKNLGFLTSVYTELPYFKDEGKRFDPEKTQRGQYYKYNAKDSLAAHQIYKIQQNELDELKVRQVYENLVRVMPIYSKMEDRGIRIDKQEQLKLLCKYESLYHIHELMLRALLNRNYFNPLSPKQCVDVIFTELKYSKVRGMKSTKDGGPSTDEESLDLLLVNGESNVTNAKLILKAIVAARKIHKVIEILQLHLHPDDRMRCEWNLAGTENGRTSASETTDQYIYLDDKGKVKVINLGHSLQTIGKHGFMIAGVTYGKDLRSMFVPSPGFTFVEADLKGAEARVDRILAGNYDMSIFDGPGIHKLTASWIYDCQPSDIQKNVLIDGVDRYHMGKTVRHAGERNMTPDRLVMITQRPLYECRQILNKFHESEPFIRKVFHNEIRKALDAPEHCLVSPNGRRRDFFDRIDKSTYNEAISFLPQTIVSDQTKFAGILKTFSESGIYEWASLLAEQHDGVLAEVKSDRVYEYAELYKTNIESEPIDFKTCTLSRDYQLVIPCEISVGDNWYNMKEVELETTKAA